MRQQVSLPYWHFVKGSFEDKLRDHEGTQMRVGNPALIVLDGIADNSTNVKFEIVRDLLEQYSSIPRIVIGAGSDPFMLFFNHIHQPVNNVLFFNETTAKRKQL
jgi:hypothetical protein